MNDLVAAFLLISASPDQMAWPLPPVAFPDTAAAVRRVALRLEVIDHRETYLLRDPACWPADLDVLRCRYRELRDAPYADAAWRFPDRHRVTDGLVGNRQARYALVLRRDLERDREDLFDAAIADLDARYKVLDAARDAGNDCYYLTNRRQALARLKESLTAREWALGLLPAPTPEEE